MDYRRSNGMKSRRSNGEESRRTASLSGSGSEREYSFALEYEGPLPSYPVQIAEAADSGFSLPEDAIVGSEQSAEREMTDMVFSERSSPSFASSPNAVTRVDMSPPSHGENETLSYAGRADPAETRPDFSFPGSHSTSISTHSDNSNGVIRTMAEQTSADPSTSTPQQRKKGECHLCGRISRLHEKETCLVCKAKYCNMCVLTAMGSMPEGRKCVGCIGQPVEESTMLGKPSRLLNRLLSPLEVQQIMKAERECLANQLRPDKVCVNGKQLRAEELAELLGCGKPPSKLKPGRYWYDKQSGYWGKEGEKPDKIITAGLNVGGPLQEKASHGSAEVYINGREITKTELKMLKFAGVECQRNTHLWVYDDGQYQEEGQRLFPGNIWGKATTKFVYSLFSLPTPNSNKVGATTPVGHSLSVPAYLQQNAAYKLLLLGHEGSGTSTIFKQAKFLSRDVGFTQEELRNVVLRIRSNIYKYISILLEARERFEDEEEAATASIDKTNDSQMESHSPVSSDVKPSMPSTSESGESGEDFVPVRKNPYAVDARLKIYSDSILETVANGHMRADFPTAIREEAPLIEELWKDPAIQATYKRKADLHMLPNVAEYFLERVVDVSSNYYQPTDQDILYAEGVTQGSGLVEIEFSLDESSVSETYNEGGETEVVRFHLVRINASGMTEGWKLLDMFEDVGAVIFCVGLDEYDQMWTDGSVPLQNKMSLSRELFENVVKHSCFHDTPFVLLLNKYDVFEEKIQSIPLTMCEWFSDFDPVQTSRYNPAHQAYTYIAHKFKKHYEHISALGRKLYTFQLTARNRSTVSAAFQYVNEILKWEETKASNYWNIQDESIYNSETSSFSPFVQSGDH